MVQCPVCRSDQIVFVVSPRRTSCYNCRASWIQDDSSQTAIDRSEPRALVRPASQGAAAP
jgi:transposase-like protein